MYVIYVCYIYPELRIGDYFFRSGKRAVPLSEGASREQGESRKGALREYKGAKAQFHVLEGAQYNGSPIWLPFYPATDAHVYYWIGHL